MVLLCRSQLHNINNNADRYSVITAGTGRVTLQAPPISHVLCTLQAELYDELAIRDLILYQLYKCGRTFYKYSY